MINRSVQADAMTLMDQAPMTVEVYASKALKWCKDNKITLEGQPIIIAAFIQACTNDYDSASKLKGLEDMAISLERISDAIAMSKDE